MQGCRANATTTVLYVTDECDCADSQLTVPQDVFLQYFGSSLALGQVNITYRQASLHQKLREDNAMMMRPELAVFLVSGMSIMAKYKFCMSFFPELLHLQMSLHPRVL